MEMVPKKPTRAAESTRRTLRRTARTLEEANPLTTRATIIAITGILTIFTQPALAQVNGCNVPIMGDLGPAAVSLAKEGVFWGGATAAIGSVIMALSGGNSKTSARRVFLIGVLAIGVSVNAQEIINFAATATGGSPPDMCGALSLLPLMMTENDRDRVVTAVRNALGDSE